MARSGDRRPRVVRHRPPDRRDVFRWHPHAAGRDRRRGHPAGTHHVAQDGRPRHPLRRCQIRDRLRSGFRAGARRAARLHRAMRPFIAERYATGADLGTREDDIIAACQLVGLTHPLQAGFKTEGGAGLSRVKQALALSSEGIPITELIAGYGVAECTAEASDVLGVPLRGATVALQGFGNVGGAAARYLDRARARITVVADIEGTIVDEDGLDVPHLLSIRDRFGRIDRRRLKPGTRCEPEPAWLGHPADIMITAALGNASRADNQAA